MAQIRRPVELKFHVTPEERDVIEKKRSQMGTDCTAAYLRKMALDGYVVNLNLPEMREMVTLLRRFNGNLNQIAKRVNATGRVYSEDIHDIHDMQEQLWTTANEILSRLAILE